MNPISGKTLWFGAHNMGLPHGEQRGTNEPEQLAERADLDRTSLAGSIPALQPNRSIVTHSPWPTYWYSAKLHGCPPRLGRFNSP